MGKTGKGSLPWWPGKLLFELLESAGPGPFVTRRLLRRPDGSRLLWLSRHHRKAIFPEELTTLRAVGRRSLRSLWMPDNLNWWIGTIFALGSFLFALGSVLYLFPSLATALQCGTQAVNGIFFAGSIPFTTAAYLQLYQAANAGEFSPENEGTQPPIRRKLIGWNPRNIGWLSCALQFPGTLCFNLSTVTPLVPNLSWLQQDIWVWCPDVAGSILFLASGYLAFTETCHAFWRWKPADLSWWITFTNLLGCLAFMTSAIYAYVPESPFSFNAATVAVVFTLLGAMGFFIGSLLMLPEAEPDEAAHQLQGPELDLPTLK